MGSTELVNLLHKEVTPALGCTEPVAVALAAAKSYGLIGGSVQGLELVVSSNIFKNAKAVGIPCTEYTGVEIAAALGVSLEQPSLDLNLFSHLSEEVARRALRQLGEISFRIQVKEDLPSVYIDAEVITDVGFARAIIAERHTNFVYLEKNGQALLDERDEVLAERREEISLGNFSLEELLQQALAIPAEELEFLLEGPQVNMKIAEAGLTGDVGLGIGQRWQKIIDRGLLTNDLTSKIAQTTGAACDARMAGVKLPVMSSAGSGNHGLVAILPIAVVGEHLGSGKEEIARALALSHLVTLYNKEFTGRLSSICGCAIAAGAGAAVGITYLLEGDSNAMQSAVTNVVSNLAGMICDGGKVGCALKLCTSAVTAWWSALLACEGLTVPAGNGIVAATCGETMANLGSLAKQGMKNVDSCVISILKNHPGVERTAVGK